MTATKIGYARCSTDTQDLTAQKQALEALGVTPERIYTDHGLTGTNRARPGLDQASGPAREIGQSLTPRLVFGWPAMREKILLNENGLDDVTTELLKMAVIRAAEGVPIQPGVDLRVLDAQDLTLVLARQNATTGEIVQDYDVPRETYDDIAANPDDWADLRTQLSTGPFVDIQKLYLGEGRPAISGAA